MLIDVLRFLDRRNRIYAGALVVLMLVNSFAEALSLGLVIPVLSVLANPDGVRDNPYLRAAYDFTGVGDVGAFVVLMAMSLIGVFLVKNAFVAFLQFTIFRFVWENVGRMARTFIRGYLRQPYAFHLATSKAYMTKNITYCIPNLFYGVVLPTLQIATEALVIVGIVTVLALASPATAFIAIIGLGLVMALIYKVLRARMSDWGRRVNQTFERILATVDQILSGIKEIKVQGREDYFHDRFDVVITENIKARQYNSTALQMPRLILEVVLVGAMLTTLAVFVRSGASLATMIPILGLYGMAAMRLLPSFNRIATNLNHLDFNRAAMADLLKDLDAFRVTQAAKPVESGDAMSFDRQLDLVELSFSYAGRENATLKGLTLSIPKGAWIALVGPSGAGKTTIANILLGLFTADRGQVLIDGRAVNTESQAWRSRVGFIPQDIFVLHDSFRRNIGFGELDKDIDEKRLLECIRAAQLDAVVANLPRGLDTVIGTGGISLSGGEAQRMAIARALYHGADILIMDEPTSALDAETEQAIVGAISRLAGQKTIITIAHRLSTIRQCNRLFLIEDGRVTAEGAFDELESGNPTFRRMVAALNVDAHAPAPGTAAANKN
jgi:ATP-binding cassette subfamily C protein